MNNRKKAILMVVVAFIFAGTYIYKTFFIQTIETPTTFISEDDSSSEPTSNHSSGKKINDIGEKEDLGKSFIASFFSFSENSLEVAKNYAATTLLPKLEKDSLNDPVTISNINLVDSSVSNETEQLVFSYVATTKDNLQKKGKVFLILETKDEKTSVKDYEWAYEKEN